MKKRVLYYLVAAASALSMQSCVTNYVASKPATTTETYKSDAKITAVTIKKAEEDRKQLLNSFASINTAKVAAETAEKKAEIEKSIKHSKTIDGILAEAETYIGTPYRFGGMTRNGIDCSAFVLSVFGAAAGRDLPRVAAAQSQEGESVSRENLQKGDLIFFSHGGGRISHVAIVYDVTADGDIKFIHAATSRGVMVSSLHDSYWAPKFRFAKRIISDDTQNYNTLAHN